MGLSELKTSLGKENLTKVALEYNQSISQTWYLTVGSTCVAMVGSLMMDWRSVKAKRS